ncbi:MAG: substrate-binding domain-containing protein, partial [Gaiellaceae bacterium]
MNPPLDRAALLKLAAGAALGGTVGFPQAHPTWRFVFVNHALTNPFFVPAKYGSYDAAALVGATAEWTGSASSDVGEMVVAMRQAIAGGAGGIAVSIIDPQAFNGPTALALAKGIPVVSYNADGGKSNERLAYFGQDLYQSGLELGARLVT